MNTGEFTHLSDAGWEGLRATQLASGPRHTSRRSANEAGLDVAVATWEAAYRRYGQASAQSMRSADGDAGVVQQMAATSWDVAVAWRQIARGGGLPWWSLAALESAAQAFEAQAREWRTREQQAAGQEGCPP